MVSNSTTPTVDRSYGVKPKPTLYHQTNTHTAVPIIEQHTRMVPQYSPLETSRTVIRRTQPERTIRAVTRTTQTEFRNEPILVSNSTTSMVDRSYKVKPKPTLYNQTNTHTAVPIIEQHTRMVPQYSPLETSRTVIRTTQPERTSRPVIRTIQPERTSRAVTRTTQTEIRTTEPEIRMIQPERTSRSVTRTTQTEIRTTEPEIRMIQPERTNRTLIRTTQPEITSRAVTRATQTEIRPTQPEYKEQPVLVSNSNTSIMDHSYEVKPKPTLYHYTSTIKDAPVIEQRTQVVPQYIQPETSRSVRRTTQPEIYPNDKAVISLRGENPVQVEHRYVNSQEDADSLIAELRRRGFLNTQLDPST